MITLISICDLFWLFWLLPFLLGALLWWMGNSKYNKMVAEYDGKIKGLNGKISGLEGDLSACSSKRADLEGDLALTKGRMREMEGDMKKLKAASKGSNDDLGVSALTASGAASISESSEVSKPESPAPSGGGKKSIYSGVKEDNLQIIEGIGPKMESILKENGITTLSALAGKSTSEIQAVLDKYGDKYKIIDPLTWSQQAGYAAKGDFDGLIDLQKKLDAGKDNAVGKTDSKLEKYLIKTGAIKSFKQDDLKAIEGIGPATEKLLHSNGIMTWRDLANSSATDVKAILTAAGSRFALGDPTTWPKQAELAADGKFDELREYQDFLDGGRG